VNIFVDKHLDLIKKLTTAKIDFLLIGGYAVIYYGYKRTTGDLDIWLKPDNENKKRLIQVLEKLEFSKEGIAYIDKMNFTTPIAFHFWDEPDRVDFLTFISGVKYDEADQQKEILDIEGLKVPFLHINHLITSKISTTRLKDKADIEELQKIQKLKNKS
jgi:hypothetical protein